MHPSEEVRFKLLCSFPRTPTFLTEITSGGEGDLGVYSVNNILYPTNSNGTKHVLVTEHLDQKLYGNNRHEFDNLCLIRQQLNLSEISDCDDSTDTDNITLSRVQEITSQEIARFEFLTKNRVKSVSSGTKSSKSDSLPPVKKPRMKSPSVKDETPGSVTVRSKSESSAIPTLNIPSSICDDTSTNVSPFSKEESVASSVDLKQLITVRNKSDSELCKVHFLPKLFRSERNRPKQSPKILDLELLSSINTTTDSRLNYTPTAFHTTSFCKGERVREWRDSASTVLEKYSLSNTSSVSPETEILFGGNYHRLCTGLDVPLIRKPKEDYPAITKVTTNMGNLNESSSCSSHDFQCIYDAGYGDIGMESANEPDVVFGEDHLSYKDIAGDLLQDLPKETPSKITPEAPAAEALIFREAQSTELPFYDVVSTSPSSEGDQSITLISESEDVHQERSSFWSKCFCCDLLFARQNDS